tara:strand:- start:172 stop:501 length:330 start_codon:yes stop_codon:yes gene_type:complete
VGHRLGAESNFAPDVRYPPERSRVGGSNTIFLLNAGVALLMCDCPALIFNSCYVALQYIENHKTKHTCEPPDGTKQQPSHPKQMQPSATKTGAAAMPISWLQPQKPNRS